LILDGNTAAVRIDDAPYAGHRQAGTGAQVRMLGIE
jgi:hypothetical protein